MQALSCARSRQFVVIVIVLFTGKGRRGARMCGGGYTGMTDRLGVRTGNGRMSNTDWQPLEQMLGAHCCESFMFMGRVGEIHLYKNIWTRRYLNLGPEGTCFRHTTEGYVPICRQEAINHVFS